MVHCSLMVSFGIFTLGGEFWARSNITSIFYKLITVVSTVLLYHMYGKRFILSFLFSLPRALILYSSKAGRSCTRGLDCRAQLGFCTYMWRRVLPELRPCWGDRRRPTGLVQV